MKTAIWTLLAGALVSAPLGAQLAPQQLDAPPTYAGVYDLRTGTLSPPSPADGGPIQDVVYDNTTTNGSFFTPGPGIVNMDWGTFASGGLDTVVAIQVGYATSLQAPASIDLRIRVHEDASGNGDAGTVVLDVTLTGLPNSASGNPEGFLIDVDLVAAGLDFTLPDGPIGYSYEMFETSTGPLLVGPPNETGVIDLIDQYDSSLAFLGSGNFGAGGPMASFVLEVTGEGEPVAGAFEEFGEPSAAAVTISGEGSGVPGEDISLRLAGFFNQTATLVVGLEQTDLFGAPGVTYFTIPWVAMFPGLPLGFNPSVFNFDVTLPAALPVGAEIFFQHFSNNAFGVLQNSNGLKLTIQSP